MAGFRWSMGWAVLVAACGGRVEISPDGDVARGGGSDGAHHPPATGAASSGGSGGLPWDESPLFGPQERPLGRSYAQWLERYWQWHLSLPFTDHPREGGDCTRGQAEDIWFLTTGRNGEVEERQCAIPEGRPIGVLLNSALFYPGPDCFACSSSESSLEVWVAQLPEQMARTADRIRANEAYLEIDGAAQDVDDTYFWEADQPISVAVPATDPYFPCTGPIQQDVCGWKAGTSRPFASLGYLAVLRPPPEGTHVVRLGAMSSDGTWLTDVIYTLEIRVQP